MQISTAVLSECNNGVLGDIVKQYIEKLGKDSNIYMSMNTAFIVYVQDDLSSTVCAVASLIGYAKGAVVILVFSETPSYKKDQFIIDFDRYLTERQYTHIYDIESVIVVYGMLNKDRLISWKL